MNKDTETTTAPDTHDSNRLGLEERRMLLALTGPQPRLRYPTEMLSILNGSMVEKYVIPEAEKAKILSTLYPFECVPQLDWLMLDIHSGKRFFVKDYIVVREGDGNFIVSPYYPEAGGTVLDWMPVSQTESQKPANEEEGTKQLHEQHPQLLVLAVRQISGGHGEASFL